MGCDIHTYIEYKCHINKEEKWVDGNFYKKNLYFDGIDESEKEYEIVAPYRDRNYTLFSILAGVRNYADNKTICEPRGVPDDCCKEIRQESDGWGVDGHTHSYFTLAELYEQKKKYQTVKHEGMISPEAFENLKKGIKPTEWCGWTSRADWVKAKWTEDCDILAKLIKAVEKHAEHFLWAWDKEKMQEVADKIRVVFWFDN